MPATDTPFFIDVITTVRDDPDAPPLREHRINYHSPSARKWLSGHCYWAFTNGYAVHTAASVK